MKTLLPRLRDLIVPHFCVACGKKLAYHERHLCVVCMQQLVFDDSLEHYDDNEIRDRMCLVPNLRHAAALLNMTPITAPSLLIRRFKYQGSIAIGEWLSGILVDRLRNNGFFADIDLLLPVPLTKGRADERGFNQAQIIANVIARHTGIPVVNNAVERIHFRCSQAQVNDVSRMDNVRGAFRLSRPEALAGRHVLIIDDILTTGATCTEVALTASQAPDVAVSVLLLAKTDAR